MRVAGSEVVDHGDLLKAKQVEAHVAAAAERRERQGGRVAIVEREAVPVAARTGVSAQCGAPLGGTAAQRDEACAEVLGREVIVVCRPVVLLHFHGRVEDHLGLVSACATARSGDSHRVGPRPGDGDRLEHGIFACRSRRGGANRDAAGIEQLYARLKRRAGIDHHGDRLTGVHVDRVAVGFARDSDDARGRRVVDQAAQRLFGLQRHGITRHAEVGGEVDCEIDAGRAVAGGAWRDRPGRRLPVQVPTH